LLHILLPLVEPAGCDGKLSQTIINGCDLANIFGISFPIFISQMKSNDDAREERQSMFFIDLRKIALHGPFAG